MDRTSVGGHASGVRQHRLHLHGSGPVERMQELLQLTRALTRAGTLQTLLDRFLEGALELVDSECGHIQLLDERHGRLVLQAHSGFDGSSQADRHALGIPRSILQMRERLFLDVVRRDPPVPELGGIEVSADLRAAQVTPLLSAEGRCIGILTTYSEAPYERTSSTLRMLDDLAAHAVELLERLQGHEELEATIRGRDDFLATVAHELRNSLAPLRTSVEVQKMVRLSDPVQVRARGILDGRLGTMARLIDDLMDAGRIATGKLSLQCERTSLVEILESAVEAVSASIEQHRHELVCDLPKQTVLVEADPVRMVQVFVNLLDNACKYTPAGGRIAIRVALQTADARVSIQDTGIGIAADTIPTLFELFSQEPRGRSRRSGGLGIGLALVQGIVRMHGGTVEAKSQGIGQGSTFTVTLPLAAATPEHARSRAAPVLSPNPSNLFSLRVIVADGNPDNATMLAGLLGSHGHQARVAHDGAGAIETTREFDPDLVFLDVSLPPHGAAEVAERIRQLPLPRQPEIIELARELPGDGQPRPSAHGIGDRLPASLSCSSVEQIVESITHKVNAIGEISTGFIITQLELSLTVLTTTAKTGDGTARSQALQRAHLAYERGMNLFERLKSDPAKRATVQDRLEALAKKLRAAGEIP